jgi:bifunctional DNase/RNase
MLEALERSVQPNVEEFLEAMEAMAVIETEVDVVMRVPYEAGPAGAPRRLKTRHRDRKVALLKEEQGGRILPIWIGADDGHALVLGLCGQTSGRPLGADLAGRLVEVAGARVERVVIKSFQENTYFATVAVTARGETHEIDARPSDALNLAARAGAPVLVDPEVMDRHAVASDRELEGRLDAGLSGQPPGEWRSLTHDLIRSLRSKGRGLSG